MWEVGIGGGEVDVGGGVGGVGGCEECGDDEWNGVGGIWWRGDYREGEFVGLEGEGGSGEGIGGE